MLVKNALLLVRLGGLQAARHSKVTVYLYHQFLMLNTISIHLSAKQSFEMSSIIIMKHSMLIGSVATSMLQTKSLTGEFLIRIDVLKIISKGL
jgi:hypothetical protein